MAGCFSAILQWHDKQASQTIYVLNNVHQPLLGKEAIAALGIISRIKSLKADFNFIQKFKDLFIDLGRMAGDYHIRLKIDAKLSAVFTPRCVPVQLLPQVKTELDKLQSFGVIKRVDEPNPWCAPFLW